MGKESLEFLPDASVTLPNSDKFPQTMTKETKRIRNAISIGLLLLASAFLILHLSSDTKGKVVIVNQSSEQIESGEIEVCNQHLILSRINPYDKKELLFKIYGDSHYTITLRLKSGKVLKKELGYVTGGIESVDNLVVNDTEIILLPLNSETSQPNRPKR